MATFTETAEKAGRLLKHAVGAALSHVHAGDAKITSRQPGETSAGTIQLTCPVITPDGKIPRKYSPQGENLSPPLAWTGVPPTAAELVLIIEDPDAPFLNPFIHWILHGLPPTSTGLPEGVPTTPSLPDGAKQGKNDAKTIGYYGPQPPMGHGVHHYHFQLFALDKTLGLGADATLADLREAMKGHVIADGEVIGTYERTASSEG